MKGYTQLDHRLRVMNEKVISAVRTGQREAAQTTWTEAKRIVPVRTGRLKRSIGIREAANVEKVIADTPYAGYVERKKPYLLPAFQASGYLRHMIKNLREAL